jgi:acetyltransferase/esterase
MKEGIPPHSTVGNGAPLLLIHGSGGDLDSYSRIELSLAATYRVIAYQRRSEIIGCATPTLSDHVDDALAVLDACGAGTAYVLGSSAGAVIGLCLLSAHPERVLGLIAHEPPVLDVLDDRTFLLKRLDLISTVKAKHGIERACAAFFDETGILGESAGPITEYVSKAVSARPIPPIREIHPILDYVPDLQALRVQREKLVLAIGGLPPHSMPVRATVRLAELLVLTPLKMPGNHFGYMDFTSDNDPDCFREVVVKAIAGFGIEKNTEMKSRVKF